MLEAQVYTIYQERLEDLMLVNGELNQVGGVFNFDSTCFLLEEVELSCSRYETDRIERKALEEKEPAPKKRNYLKDYKWKRRRIYPQKDQPMYMFLKSCRWPYTWC